MLRIATQHHFRLHCDCAGGTLTRRIQDQLHVVIVVVVAKSQQIGSLRGNVGSIRIICIIGTEVKERSALKKKKKKKKKKKIVDTLCIAFSARRGSSERIGTCGRLGNASGSRVIVQSAVNIAVGAVYSVVIAVWRVRSTG
jgi:hypothetical protein